LGALIVFTYVGIFAVALSRTRGCRRVGALLAALLVMQILLGIANVMLTLPLPVAVAHNAGAAALLVSMVVINFALSRSRSPH
jgi:cytochrome c oxidase assembly protein subunit 15